MPVDELRAAVKVLRETITIGGNADVAEPMAEILEQAITRGAQYDTVTRQLVAIGGPNGGPCLALARALNRGVR